MRHTGIACVGALLVAWLGFRVPTEPPAALPGAESASAAGVAPAAEAAVQLEGPVTPTEGAETPPELRVEAQELRAAADPPAPPEDRRYGRRSRNIYPGPIPTPADWQPPEGPVRVALQAGHWKAQEAPDELRGLRDNGTGARGRAEWEVNLEIAQRAAAMLEARGYVVDVLPAVVPPGYRAHLFISIHADGSNDPRASGYRVAAPRRDATGRAQQMAELLEDSYGEATGIRRLRDVTRRMSNYYAFNFRRYVHALHPMTIAVILETGFLTSESDWGVIVEDPDRSARGIVEAVTRFPITPPPVGGDALATQVD